MSYNMVILSQSITSYTMCSLGDVVVVVERGAQYAGHKSAASAMQLDRWVAEQLITEHHATRYAVLGVYMTPSCMIIGIESLDTGQQYMVGYHGLEVVGHILDYEEKE